MTFLDEKSTRHELVTAVVEAGFTAATINNTTDAELLGMLRTWIEAGDECGSC